MIEAERLRAQVLELLQLLPGDVLLVTYKTAEEARSADAVRTLVAAHTEGRALGLFGERRVNVLLLNLALDRMTMDQAVRAMDEDG
jgi:hypothetical protein